MASRVSLVKFAIAGLMSLIIFGCNEAPKKEEEQVVEIELRDFTIKEKNEESSVSGKWNSFSGTGTIATRDPRFQRKAAFIVLQIVDKSEGSAPEPATQFVLLRDGLGKIETYKSEYGEMVSRPEYEWTVLGWIMLEGPGKLNVVK